jgi:multiple sugar transport system substrate-binding protein
MAAATRRQVLGLGAGAAAALAGSRRLAAQPAALQVTASPSIWQSVYEEMSRAYERAGGARIVLAGGIREDEDHVQRLLRGALVDDLPDVVLISTSVVRLLAERSIIRPIDAALGSRAALARIGLVAGAEAVTAIDDALYGLPFGISVPVIAYNAELVRRAGGDPDGFPADWDAVVALVRRVGALGGSEIGGFFEYDNTANWTFQALVTTQGGTMISGDGRHAAFGGPEGLAALRILRDFGQAGQGRADMTRDQGRQAFAAGTIGMIVTSSGSLPGLERQAGGRFAVRAARLPVPHPQGRVPASGIAMLTTARDAARLRAATDYMLYAAGADAQTAMARATGLVAVNRIALEDPGRLANLVVERPNLRAALDTLPVIGPWSIYPGENGIRIVAVIKDYLQAVVTQQQSPEQALAAMTRDVDALLAR